MHLRFLLGLALTVATLHASIGVNSTYEEVIAEKGQPSGKMQAGSMLVLRYADATIKLKGGKVVAVQSANRGDSAVNSTTTAAPAAAPQPARKAGGLSWRTDYETAVADARYQDRRVLLFFTGSDWCPWCKKLVSEIFSTPEFASYASENLILVEIDFPREKFQSPALKKQNQELQRQYRIGGYPSVVMLDPNGKPLRVLGYQEGGPEPFIRLLKKL